MEVGIHTADLSEPLFGGEPPEQLFCLPDRAARREPQTHGRFPVRFFFGYVFKTEGAFFKLCRGQREKERKRFAADGKLRDLLFSDPEIFAALTQARFDARIPQQRVFQFGIGVLHTFVLYEFRAERTAIADDALVSFGHVVCAVRYLLFCEFFFREFSDRRGRVFLRGGDLFRGRAPVCSFPADLFAGNVAESGVDLFSQFRLCTRVHFRLHAKRAPGHRAAQVTARTLAREPLFHVEFALPAGKLRLRYTRKIFPFHILPL